MKSKTNNYKSYKVNKVNERGDITSNGNNIQQGLQCFTICTHEQRVAVYTNVQQRTLYSFTILNKYFQHELYEISHRQIVWLPMTVVNEFMLFCVIIIVAINYDCSAMLSENLKATKAKALN